ncbi:MAG: hypothetical protein AAB152_04230 [Candidatus Coatesbacteria bacterium]
MIPRRLLLWILVAVCVPMWARIAGVEMVYLSDSLRQHYPFQAVTSRLLAEAPSRLPRWDPYLFCGHPLLADPTFQAWYPPAMLYRFLPFPVAFGCFLALHLVLAAVGMAVFVTRLGVGGPAAGLAAVAYALGAHPAELLSVPPVLCAYAWLPWVAWTADRLAAGGGARAAAGLAVVFGWLALAGYPPALLYAAVLAVVVMACRDGERRWVVPSLAAAVVAAAVAAALLLPFAGYLGDTARAHGFTPAEADAGSMPLWGVLGFLVPHAFLPVTEVPVLGTPGLWTSLHYAGAIPLALAVGVLVLRRRDPGLRAPVWLIVAGLALALGHHLPVVGPFLLRVPPFSFIRHPGLWAALAGFGVAWLAAVGADEIERKLHGAEGRRVMAGWALAVVFLGAMWAGSKVWEFGQPRQMLAESRWGPEAIVFAGRMGNVWYPAAMIGCGLVFLGLAVRREIGIRTAVIALGVLTCADVWVLQTQLQPGGKSEWIMAASPTERWFTGAVRPGTWGRVLVTPRLDFREFDEGKGRRGVLENMRAAFRTNLPAAGGLRQAGGNDPLRPAATEAYLDGALRLPVQPWEPKAVEIFDRLGVRWLVTDSRLNREGLRLVHKGYVGIYERTGRAPRPAWVEPGESGMVRTVVSRHPGEWDLAVDLRAPGLVIVSESYVRGWRLEGAPPGSRVIAAPGGLIGVVLPLGRHGAVRLRYAPWTIPAGLGLSFLAFAGLVGFALRRASSRA